MALKNYLYIFISVLLSGSAFGQSACIKGIILSDSTPVIGAVVSIPTLGKGTQSNVDGKFYLSIEKEGVYTLRIQGAGFKTLDTVVKAQIQCSNLELHLTLDEAAQDVVITGSFSEVSRMESVQAVEVYQSTFFKKNPTPNLFDALQLINGVRPQLNCSVCNTGDIHINGLEGPYTMILLDGMPIVSGLSTVYGLMGIPNSMIQRIEVMKGPGGALYGSEAIGGVINVITKQPEKAAKFSADIMTTTYWENNIDLAYKYQHKKVSALFGLNYFYFGNKLDLNKDGFTDVTQQNRLSLFQKWSFQRKDNRVATIAGRYVYEDRWGGQLNYTPAFRGGDSIYGESIYTHRWEIIGAYQLPVSKQNILLQYSLNQHQQNSMYGITPFIANQWIGFSQLVWNKKIGKHELLNGVAIRMTNYDDNTVATKEDNPIYKRNVLLPGIFTQDSWKFHEKWTALGGIRLDHHNVHGWITTPRAGIRYQRKDSESLRLNIGSGFRVVSVFTEDHAALTGSRQVEVHGNLQPERSWNANLNYLRNIHLKKSFIVTDVTLFYSYFTNKIIPDYYTDANKIIYSNLNGYAVSSGVTLNLEYNFAFPLKARGGVTFMDVYSMQKDSVNTSHYVRPLLTEHWNGSFGLSYTISKWGVTIDYTGNLTGPMKLPLQANDFRKEFSPWWSIQNIQLTKKWGTRSEVYFGVKNLLNYRPPANSIMRAFDPFDKKAGDVVSNPNGYTFDTTYMFAPNQGIRMFLGIRFVI
ncbi:MAG: TonB-dependent receptor [Cytophagaceae bacterium]